MPQRSSAPAPMCWSRARPCSRAVRAPIGRTSRRSAGRRRRRAARSRDAAGRYIAWAPPFKRSLSLPHRPLSDRARAMIPRYSRPEMAAIWDPQTRYRIWFEIEAHATDALAELGLIPKAAAEIIRERGRDAQFD